MKSFDESAMSRTQAQFWYNRFKVGDARPGHPSTSTTATLKQNS